MQILYGLDGTRDWRQIPNWKGCYNMQHEDIWLQEAEIHVFQQYPVTFSEQNLPRPNGQCGEVSLGSPGDW